MEDWYEVLRTGIPGQPRRARKVICGGHSLGGPLTAAFASWDFDGDPATRRDAGYKQCAGLVGLDTTLALGGGSGGGPPLGGLGDAVGGAAPYVNVPPLTPETIEVPNVFGVGAYFDPEGTDLTAELPHTSNIDLSQRVLFSRDAAHFASNDPDIRDFTLTNEASLAGILDDNSAPLSFLRSSVGQLVGGPLVDKNFPTPGRRLPGPARGPGDAALLLGALPRGRRRGPRDRAQRRGAAVHLARGRGLRPAPARADAVRGAGELHRAVLPDQDPHRRRRRRRAGGFAQLRYDGPSLRPALLVQAGDSDENSRARRGQADRRRAAERARAQPRDHDPGLQPPRRRHRRLAPERRPPGADQQGARHFAVAAVRAAR